MLNDQLNKLKLNCSNFNYQKNLSLDFLYTNQPATAVDFELIINALDILFLEKYDRPLSAVEGLLLEGIWQTKTYSEIAKENNYSSDYFSNVAAPRLLKQLSKLLECRINKKNCRSIITKYIMEKSNDSQNDGAKRKISLSLDTASNYSFGQENSFFDFSFLQDAILLTRVI